MPKSVSASELRAEIKRILNEVRYGQHRYVVERFGEPTAAIVSIEDLDLLQRVRREQARTSLREAIASVRERGSEVDPDQLQALIEEARSDFCERQGPVAGA